ncbi:MAG: DUF5676 family membrane protein [Burkholderiales bacterium]
MRILVVEDEPTSAQYLQKGLTENGFVVDVATNGIDGAHLALNAHYDLIVLDVMLPGADGWQVIRMWHEAALDFLNALFHGLDFRKVLLPARDYGIGVFLYPLTILAVWAFFVGALFAVVRNFFRRD